MTKTKFKQPGSILVLITINLLHLINVNGEVQIISRDTQDVVIRIEDTQALSMPERQTEEGIEGYVVYSNPPDACSPVKQPPSDFPYNVQWILLTKHSENCSLRNKTDNAIIGGYDGIIIHNVGSNSSEDMDEAFDPTECLIWTCFIGEYDGIVLQHNFSYPADQSYTTYARITPDPNGGPSSLSEWLVFLVAFLVILCFCALLVVPVLMLWNAVLGVIDKCRRIRRRRIRSAIIDRFPITDWSVGDVHQTCVICLEDFVENDRVRVLPCNHGFHSDCIDPWLKKWKRFCPICKRKVIRNHENVEQMSDSDNEETPLLRAPPNSRPNSVSINSPVTGTTFVQQSENPFRRAFRLARERRTARRENRNQPQSGTGPTSLPDVTNVNATLVENTQALSASTSPDADPAQQSSNSANKGVQTSLSVTNENIPSTSTSSNGNNNYGPSTSTAVSSFPVIISQTPSSQNQNLNLIT